MSRPRALLEASESAPGSQKHLLTDLVGLGLRAEGPEASQRAVHAVGMKHDELGNASSSPARALRTRWCSDAGDVLTASLSVLCGGRPQPRAPARLTARRDERAGGVRYRSPVTPGPSGNTWPRSPAHMPRSSPRSAACRSCGPRPAQRLLGPPLGEARPARAGVNFVPDENNSARTPAHRYVPERSSFQNRP